MRRVEKLGGVAVQWISFTVAVLLLSVAKVGPETGNSGSSCATIAD